MGRVDIEPRQTDGSRPLIIQVHPDVPLLRGVGEGADVLCPNCRSVVLFENVFDDSVYDLVVRCAGCGRDSWTPAFPPGRGLGGAFRGWANGTIEAHGTLDLARDEVLIGAPRANRRQSETGRLRAAGPGVPAQRVVLDATGLTKISDRARAIFAPILPPLERRFKRGKRDQLLPPELLDAVDHYAEMDSEGRRDELDAFKVAVTALRLEASVGPPPLWP